jgi:hypothetical protein
MTMRRISTKMFYFLFLAIVLGVVNLAHALPTLFFDGDVGYTYADGLLRVDAVLTGYEDLSSNPVLAGSSLVFNASLTGSISDTSLTTGIFGTAPVNPDITITGGDNSNLLEGEFVEILMRGSNSSDFGILSGQFTPTGGDLLSEFTSPSDTISLVLNLDTTFSSDMFDSNFNGQIDGRAFSPAPIPEPATWILLGLGTTAIMVFRKRKRTCT